MPASQIISQLLDVTGDGTGITDMRVNGSVTPVVAKFSPTKPCEIHRMIVHIEDAGNLVAGTYGAEAALTNGVTMTQTDDSNPTIVNTLTGQNGIKTNSDWGHVCYDVRYNTFGSGNNFVTVRWTFAKSGIPLKLESGDSLNVNINDNLEGLISHHFLIQGFYK